MGGGAEFEDEQGGDGEEEPAEVGFEKGLREGGAEGAMRGLIEAERAGENAGVDEEDRGEGEDPAGAGESEIAEAPEDWDEQEDGGVVALVDGQEADEKQCGQAEEIQVE